jgi:hypothetical protein
MTQAKNRAVRDAPREREPLEPRSTADPILMIDGCRYHQRYEMLEPFRQRSHALENIWTMSAWKGSWQHVDTFV